jgi:hypothetical protein
MGRNFYIRFDKDSGDEDVHIGKQSYGWNFVFDIHSIVHHLIFDNSDMVDDLINEGLMTKKEWETLRSIYRVITQMGHRCLWKHKNGQLIMNPSMDDADHMNLKTAIGMHMTQIERRKYGMMYCSCRRVGDPECPNHGSDIHYEVIEPSDFAMGKEEGDVCIVINIPTVSSNTVFNIIERIAEYGDSDIEMDDLKEMALRGGNGYENILDYTRRTNEEIHMSSVDYMVGSLRCLAAPCFS